MDPHPHPLPRFSFQSDSPPGDRFIPNRSLMDISHAQTLLTTRPEPKNPDSPFGEVYRRMVEEKLTLDSQGRPFRMLVFRGTPQPRSSCGRSVRYVEESVCREEEEFQYRTKRIRRLPKSEARVLDAPNLRDDYYLNLVDWGKNNFIAIGLGSNLFLWNAGNGDIAKLVGPYDSGDYPTSVSWSKNAKILAVGFDSSEIQLWDVESSKLIRSLRAHRNRVGCLAWNGQLLTSGGHDSLIFNHDLRVRRSSRVRGHTSEVCGLKWSDGGTQLASGGNDNLVHIWEASNMTSNKFLHRFTDHRAAVKALAWCPYQYNVLASGGGTADRCIKLWNSQTGKCIQSIDTTSQVCGLEWNRHQKEILSGHGYMKNQLCLWRYPSMSKTTELAGHTHRILCLSQNPEGSTVVSAGADQTLRLWKVFEPPEKTTGVDNQFSESRFQIR